jgi:hypothetical protein
MTNWTQQEFAELLERPEIGELNKELKPRRKKITEIQGQLSLAGDELFHRLLDNREKRKLETTVQSNYFEWVRINKPYAEALRSAFAVPNGGSRPKKTAAIMKAEGMEAGVPDLMILSPARGYAGLVIETKTKYNQPSDEQKEWLNRLARNNFYCVVAWSTIDMVNITCWFYNLPDDVRHRWPIK